MAQDLILSDLTKAGKTPLNLVLDDYIPAEAEESTDADVFWRFDDEPTATPQLLGSVSAGSSLQVPFDMSHGRAIRLFLVSKTSTGNFSAQNVLEAVQMVFDPNSNDGASGLPPTGLSAEETSPGEVALTWTNNGGTGDNVIERKHGASGSYALVTTVAFSTNSFDDTLAIAGLYYYRIYNEDVPGYSNEVSVLVSV